MNKLKSINWSFICVIAFWCLLTLARIFHHSPWYDESHAWDIAQELNFFELINFMKVEGHTFIWYLILMPFAKTNFLYPYSMLIINWIFCFIALCILWLKAPFNNWIKAFITLSFPFLSLYPIIARCYSIGIMFLFILLSLDKDKLKHPNWYATLLILLANTSLMGAIPAAVLGFIFAFDMIKNKQKLLIPFSIAIFGAILILIQLCGSLDVGLSPIEDRLTLSEKLRLAIRYFQTYFISFGVILSSIFAFIFYFKNKIVPKFFIISTLLLLGLFFVYAGYLWHWMFIYIYFISSCWIISDNDNFKYKKLLNISLCIISIFLILYIPLPNDKWLLTSGKNKKQMAQEILADKNLKNANILMLRSFDVPLKPLLYNSDITLVNYCDNEILNYDTRSYLKSKNCKMDNYWDNIDITLDKEVFDKWYNGNLYLLSLSRIKFTGDDFWNRTIGYKFTLYKDFGSNYLWKLEKLD